MKRIYFCELNVPMNGAIYLPLVSGILQECVKAYDKKKYKCMPFIYQRDTVENILAKYDKPYLVAFSVSIWNYELSLQIAKKVKEKFPKCIIVFGGPHVNRSNCTYYFIDHIILGEGEIEFMKLLFPDYKCGDFDSFLSPYTEGAFDYLLSENPDIQFQAIVETNRGCPFTCSFCYWGQQTLDKKVKFHSLDYIRKEAEWIGKNKIKYVFCADANFGMYKQDVEVAQIYADVKEKYGYPEKFRVCYGKGDRSTIFQSASILHKAGIAKSVTLARQSNSEDVLANIRRKNIPKETFDKLQEKYHEVGIPTYTEMILGLPGETLGSFIKGIDEVRATDTRLFVYHLSVLPNTLMADPEYQRLYGIKTVRVPMKEIHSEVRDSSLITEYEDIVIETNTMTQSEWRQGAIYAWIAQLEQMGVKDIPSIEVERFCYIAYNITKGHSKAKNVEGIYVEPEEAAYMRITGKSVEEVIYGRK